METHGVEREIQTDKDIPRLRHNWRSVDRFYPVRPRNDMIGVSPIASNEPDVPSLSGGFGQRQSQCAHYPLNAGAGIVTTDDCKIHVHAACLPRDRRYRGFWHLSPVLYPQPAQGWTGKALVQVERQQIQKRTQSFGHV